MMKTKNVLWFVSCLALLLGACSAETSGNQAVLEGKLWILTDLNENVPINGHEPTIQFDNGQVLGNASCNHYDGGYQLKSEALHFENLFNTEMACMEPVGLMEQESLYLEILGQASRFELADGVLTIFTDSGQRLVFKNSGENSAGDATVPIDDSETSGESVSLESVQAFNPPEGFKEYRDEISSISIYIPESWVVTGVVEGQSAIFQSYPEDKYVGGEMLEEGDTKCDLNTQPPGTQVSDLIEQWETSPMTEIVSKDEFRLHSGLFAQRFVIDSMGRSTVFAADIDQRAVLLACFGDFSQVDVIAATLDISK